MRMAFIKGFPPKNEDSNCLPAIESYMQKEMSSVVFRGFDMY